MNADRKSNLARVPAVFSDYFGLSRAASLGVVCFISVVIGFAIFWFIHSAPPRTLTITSGPPGSTFERYAELYRAILRTNGVTLKILPSQGSLENLQRLEDPAVKVDIGFVQGGMSGGAPPGNLVSLGSIAYEPLLVIYRNDTPIRFLSGLTGKRIATGSAGSGTHLLATTLLAKNGITEGGPTRLENLDADAAAQAMTNGTLDAVFMMSDSASSNTMRTLLHTPGLQLMSFEQADAYTRRFNYLNKLRLPEGSLDFGLNQPAQDVWLLGPTVELVARPKLNAAISDLLLEAARKVHGDASLFQNQGEFPTPMEHEFKISEDATRFYKSGKTFLYKWFPFWLASLANRVLVAFVPMMLLLIPGLRLIPTLYKWRIQLRIYRWYRALQAVERELNQEPTPDRRGELHQRFDEIEKVVKNMKVPASFGEQFYSLRQHIDYVREKLAGREPATRKDQI